MHWVCTGDCLRSGRCLHCSEAAAGERPELVAEGKWLAVAVAPEGYTGWAECCLERGLELLHSLYVVSIS